MSADIANDLLLVTAASGKQATGLLPNLKQWKRLRLQVNSESSRARLQGQYPNAEVVTADLWSQADCYRILQGVNCCFLVTPGFHANETACGQNIIDAAESQGSTFKHLVFSSVIFPNKRKMVNHDSKGFIEEYLTESDLPYTILQPTTMMENLPIAKLVREENPTHTCLWNPATQFSFVSTLDIGAAAANVLADREKHLYATYQLVGTPAPLSFIDVQRILSDELDKHVRLQRMPLDEAVTMFAKALTKGEPEKASFNTTQGIARMLMYYNEKGLVGNPNVLEIVLGRKPLGYKEWVQLKIRESKRGAEPANGAPPTSSEPQIPRRTVNGL